MIYLSMLSAMICSALIMINHLVAKKNMMNREKMSPFECGFNPQNKARLPFSLRFYLIAVIFLIFDVEITLILPIPLMSNFFKSTQLMTITLFFITILMAGATHEWNNGMLNWDL